MREGKEEEKQVYEETGRKKLEKLKKLRLIVVNES